MKKKVFGRKLSRDTDTRLALFRSLARSLILYGDITTTKSKVKAVQPFVEKLVSLAKKHDLAARRRAYARLANDRQTTNELFDRIVKAFATKQSGFTRIVNLPARRGDRAQMARLSWSETVAKPEPIKKPVRGAKKVSAKAAEAKAKPKKSDTKKEVVKKVKK